MEWYRKRFRRNLVDMHIDDWNETFLSKFDPKAYVEHLKAGHIRAPMLYLQSHVGLCYWPTRSGKMHNGFIGREDAMKQVERLCHENGMDVIAYYSLVYNNWLYEKHPEWRMVDINGAATRDHGGRYGILCPNNREYRAFTEIQIKEFCEYFDFDGVFFDMLFWQNVCYCPSCRERWEKEVGGEMPRVVNWKDPRWRLLQKKRMEWMGEFGVWAADTLHKYRPEASVENQYSTIMHHWMYGINESMAFSSTYSGGDLYGGIEEQSFACKIYYGATRNQPFEYMTSRCYPSLSEHTTTKSEDQLRLSVMMTYLHHGACLLIDAIDPAGTMDRRVYDRIGNIFRAAEPYEKYLSTGDMTFDVALYYDLNGKYNLEAAPADVADTASLDYSRPMHDALLGAARSLRGHHISYGVVNNHWFDRYKKAKVLVLSDVPDFEDGKVESVLDYVRTGGSLYMSGHCSARLLEEIFGLKYAGMTDDEVTYISPTEKDVFMSGLYTKDYPLAMFEKQPKVIGSPKGDVLGTLTLPYHGDGAAHTFASIHSNPPGIFTDVPAIVMVNYGKGKAVWCSAPIERPKREQHGEIFSNIIAMLAGGDRAFYTDAPECVECVMFDAPEEKKKLMGVINLQESFHIQPVNDFSISVACENKPKQVLLLPEERPMPFTYENGRTTVHFDSLKYCEMFMIVE